MENRYLANTDCIFHHSILAKFRYMSRDNDFPWLPHFINKFVNADLNCITKQECIHPLHEVFLPPIYRYKRYDNIRKILKNLYRKIYTSFRNSNTLRKFIFKNQGLRPPFYKSLIFFPVWYVPTISNGASNFASTYTSLVRRM